MKQLLNYILIKRNHEISAILAAMVIALLFAAPGWGATIYVTDDPNNSGTKICYKSAGWPDATCSNGTGNSDIRTAANTGAGVGGTVIIAGGTYAGTQLGSTGSLLTLVAGLTIRPAVISDGDITKVGTVLFNGNNASVSVMSLNAGTETVSNINFTQPANAFASILFRASGAIINDCNITLGNGGATSVGVDSSCSSACTATINRMSISGNFTPLNASINNNFVPTFNYSKFDGVGLRTGMQYNAAAIFNNCLYTGYTTSVMNTGANSGKTITWNNPIFYGNALTGSTSHILSKLHDQTWIVNNAIALGNPWGADTHNYSGITLNNSIQNKDPLFLIPKYPSIVVLNVDDTVNIDWFKDTIAPKLEAYGWRGTFSVNYTNTLTAANITKLLALQTAGHEIANHTRRHTDLTQTTSFTITGAALETISNNGTILTTSTGKSYTLANYSLSTLRTAMIADGYTCGTMNPGLNMGTVRATCLSDFTSQLITLPYTLLLDTTRYWNEEINGATTDLTVAGITSTTFIPPGNSTSTGLRTYLQASSGLIGARGSSNDVLSSINIYNIGYRDLLAHMTNTTACEASGDTRSNCVKRNIVAMLGKMSTMGHIYVFYTHGATEWAATDWDSMLAAIAASNVRVMTLAQAIAYAKAYNPSGDLATADNLTYTRTLIDQSNYHLRPSSPCINAGVAVGLTTDIEGKTVPYVTNPSIGAYEKPYTAPHR